MMFTRQHYEAIAQVIAEQHAMVDKTRDPTRVLGPHFVIRCVTSGLAKMFQVDNPHFTYQKFREACGETLDTSMPGD